MGVEAGNRCAIPLKKLLGAVVVVVLCDGETGVCVSVGSGFVVDKELGLIVTAAHTLINIDGGNKQYPFGENYNGLISGKVLIGVTPQNGDGKDTADFRYFAEIVAKDSSLANGECHLDACVLRITSRRDGRQLDMKSEQLSTLKITEKWEIEEKVRIVGYNQGGEGRLRLGEHVNCYVDFAIGYVCKKFVNEEHPGGMRKACFKPREEIVVICPTIIGHSGGPCVNQQGEVIGILSSADPSEQDRCYVVPSSELNVLVKSAQSDDRVRNIR